MTAPAWSPAVRRALPPGGACGREAVPLRHTACARGRLLARLGARPAGGAGRAGKGRLAGAPAASATGPGRGSGCRRAPWTRARLGSASSRACSASVPSRDSPARIRRLGDWTPNRRAIRGAFKGRRRSGARRAGREGPCEHRPRAPDRPARRRSAGGASRAAHVRSPAARRRPISTSWRRAALGLSGPAPPGPGTAPSRLNRRRPASPRWERGPCHVQKILRLSCAGATRSRRQHGYASGCVAASVAAPSMAACLGRIRLSSTPT